MGLHQSTCQTRGHEIYKRKTEDELKGKECVKTMCRCHVIMFGGAEMRVQYLRLFVIFKIKAQRKTCKESELYAEVYGRIIFIARA